MLAADAVLLVIDVQQGFLDPSWGARNKPDAGHRIAVLLSNWRCTDRPVHHVHHASRPPGHAPLPEAAPLPGEPIHLKEVNSGFIGTGLERDLRAAGVRTVVIVGLSAPHCVSTTARMAGDLGFEPIVVSDATAAFALPALDGGMRPAADVHANAPADMSGEFATLLDTDAVLRLLPAPPAT